MRFRGPCPACADELRAKYRGEGRVVAGAEYEPDDARHAQRGRAEGRLTDRLGPPVAFQCMATGTRTRDWATVDYYALLGVGPTADADEVTRAFREQAKRSHPDVDRRRRGRRRASATSTAAYGVLGDAEPGAAYDQVRAEQRSRSTVATSPGARPRRSRPKRQGAQAVDAAPSLDGVARRRARDGARRRAPPSSRGRCTSTMPRQRARFVPVTADACRRERRVVRQLRRRVAVRRMHVPEPQQHGDPNALGPTVRSATTPRIRARDRRRRQRRPRHHVRDRRRSSSSSAVRCSSCSVPGYAGWRERPNAPATLSYSRSMIVTLAWPPPSHIVCRP